MRYWLLTTTTYGTWLPGDPRGSVTSVRDRRPTDAIGAQRVEHDTPGEAWEPGMPALYKSTQERLASEPVRLSGDQAAVLLHQLRETASFRGCELLAVAIMANHFHAVIRCEGDPDPARLLGDFKAYGSRALNRKFGLPRSGTWWTKRGSQRKLPDERAVENAVRYVLHKQERPLVVWSP